MLVNTLRKKRLSLMCQYLKSNQTDFLTKIKEIEEEIFLFKKFRVLSGEKGFEISYVKDYEKTMFFLAKHMSKDPKKTTVLEFLTAFNDLKSKAEQEIMSLERKKHNRK